MTARLSLHVGIALAITTICLLGFLAISSVAQDSTSTDAESKSTQSQDRNRNRNRPQDSVAVRNAYTTDLLLGSKLLGSKEEIRETSPFAESWLEAKTERQSFIFCYSTLLSLGAPAGEVKGWLFREFDQKWEEILKVNTYSVTHLELRYDKETSTLSAVYKAGSVGAGSTKGKKNQMKGKPVFELNLLTVGR